MPFMLFSVCISGLADRAAAARQRLLQHQQAQAISQAPSLSGMLGSSTQQQYTQGSAAAGWSWARLYAIRQLLPLYACSLTICTAGYG